MNGNQPPPTLPNPPAAKPAGSGASGRAITALILGIAAFVCCFLAGIPAFFLGRAEEAAISRGEAPEAGRTLAKVGWILGLVSIILSCLSLIGVGVYIGLMGIPNMPPRGF